jgi:protein TonB
MPEVRITADARDSETFEPKERDDVFCLFVFGVVFAVRPHFPYIPSPQLLTSSTLVKIQRSNGICVVRLRHSPPPIVARGFSPRDRRAAPPTPLRHHRRLAPALLMAVVAHAALLAVLAAVPLRVAAPTTKAMPIAVQFTLAGMAGSGGNPNAGGQTPVAPAPSPGAGKLASTPPPVPTVSAPPLIVIAAPAPVPEPKEPVQPAPAAPDAPANAALGSGPIIGSVAQAGSGLGHGTGTGVGDGSGDGVAGTGGSGRGGFGGTHPDYLRIPQPHYPSVARQHGWEGTTILRVEIRADGHVGMVEVLHGSGHAVLDDAAVEAVRAGEFMPAQVGGKPVSSSVEVPIRFQIVTGQS